MERVDPGVPGAALEEGAANLLFGCAGLYAGQSLLIVREDPALGWYDAAAPLAVEALARRHRINTKTILTRALEEGEDGAVNAAEKDDDTVVYFARLGDRSRFNRDPSGRTVVMCYATTAALLGSRYGTAPYAATQALKTAIDSALFGASEIEVTCPLGTSVRGNGGGASPGGADVTVRRFPLGVPTPIPAAAFTGMVALARYLTPTGSKVYEPASLHLPSVVMAEISGGRMTGLTGDPAVVDAIKAHYRAVATRFGIDESAVHSWHAGFHPGIAYAAPVEENPDRWSNTVFTSPRALHFHTCGDYAPGEICWMVIDPTVTVDGVALWQDGQFRPSAHPLTAPFAEPPSSIAALFAEPASPVCFYKGPLPAR